MMWAWVSPFPFLGLSFPTCEMRELTKVTFVPSNSSVLYFILRLLLPKLNTTFSSLNLLFSNLGFSHSDLLLVGFTDLLVSGRECCY